MNKLSSVEMLNTFSKDSAHPNYVRELALMIFDETSEKVHTMPADYKEYLCAAALLHDIGYSIDEKSHHKHSMNLILKHGLKGFSDREEKLVACICRYHRGGLPDKKEHEIYNTFDKKDRKIVKRLAGILKIADGLAKDKAALKEIRLDFDKENNIVKFILTPRVEEFLPDISTAIRKRDLYEVAFKCQSVLIFS